MRRGLATALAAVAALLALAGSAQARAPHVLVAKTLLTFTSGVVVPNGNYALVLRIDGTGTLTTGTGSQDPVTLTHAQLRRVEGELTAVHFATLQRRYADIATPVTGIDPAVIRSGGRTVTVLPGATAPDALTALITTLRTLAQNFEATPSTALVTFITGFMIADDNDRLTLSSDGRGTLVDRSGRHTVFVGATTLARLQRRLDAANFPKLRRDYDHVVTPIRGPAPTGVIYAGHHVTVQPGARMPAALGRVIETLRTILGSFAS